MNDEIINTLATGDEKALQELKMPYPKTKQELDLIMETLLNRSHDYGTCCYAVSIAAEAAFNYVAGTLGITGFQASCADFDVLRRTRHIDGPFALFKGHDLLYPQYNLQDRAKETFEGWMPWAAEEARKKLADPKSAVSSVTSHWEWLAKTYPAEAQQ